MDSVYGARVPDSRDVSFARRGKSTCVANRISFLEANVLPGLHRAPTETDQSVNQLTLW